MLVLTLLTIYLAVVEMISKRNLEIVDSDERNAIINAKISAILHQINVQFTNFNFNADIIYLLFSAAGGSSKG